MTEVSRGFQFVALLLVIVIPREILAREAVTPGPDVGQIIRDLDGLHVDGTVFERGEWQLQQRSKY